MSKTVVFAGCSYTAGHGWLELPVEQSATMPCKESPHLWVNLCHKGISQLQHLALVNIGQGGASNTEIFQNAVRCIASLQHDIGMMFCQWTSVPRYRFNVGFELWDTSESFCDTTMRTHDVNLNRGDHWPRPYVQDLLDRLKTMHHLHWEILKVVDFSAILSRLAQKHNFDIFFINGSCPWDQDYFTRLQDVDPEKYTPFMKKDILNIDSRDDQDIFTLYNLAHDHYLEAGGIDFNSWINLYDSFAQNKIDVNFDRRHPGEQSNLTFYQMIKRKIDLSI